MSRDQIHLHQWIIAILSGLLLAGCSNSEQQQRRKDANEAQKASTVQLIDVARTLYSKASPTDERDNRIIESFKKAKQTVESALQSHPGYWPLEQQLGQVHAREGDYWSLRLTEALAAARSELNLSMLHQDHVQDTRGSKAHWEEQSKLHKDAILAATNARNDVVGKKAEAQKVLDDLNAKRAAALAEGKKLEGQAAAKEAEAQKLREQVESRQGSTEILITLAQSLKAQAIEAARLRSKAEEKNSEADALQAEIDVQQAKVDGLDSQIKTLDTEIDKYGQLLTYAKNELDNVISPRPLADGTPSPQVPLATLESGLGARLEIVRTKLAEAVKAANSATQAYEAACKQLGSAIGGLEASNRAARDSVEDPAAKAAAADNLSLLALQISLADAQVSLGDACSLLRGSGPLFEQATSLMAAAQVSVTPELALDDNQLKTNAADAYKEAREAYRKASSNPAVQQALPKVQWKNYIDARLKQLPVAASESSGV